MLNYHHGYLKESYTPGFSMETDVGRNCKNSLFPPTGGKKPGIFPEIFGNTDFLQDHQ